jgi:hypothetical protein
MAPRQGAGTVAAAAVLTSSVARGLRLHREGRAPHEAVPVRCSVLLELLDHYDTDRRERDHLLEALADARAVLAEYGDPDWYEPTRIGYDPGVVWHGGALARDALARLPDVPHIGRSR